MSTTHHHDHAHDHAHDHDHSDDHAHDHSDEHAHDHDHHHGALGHSHAPSSLKALVAVIALTGVVFFAELIAGIVSGSLALLADAAHMFSDSAGLVVALVALLVGQRGASKRATYGYRRAEVLAAALNAGTVGVIAVWIGVEAVLRLGHQEPVETGLMLVVAVIGLVVNGVSALVLVRRSHDNMNLRGAYLHVLMDMLGSVAVIIAGLVIKYTGFTAADTIASVFIALIIVPRAWKLFRAALNVLLEGVPAGVDPNKLVQELEALDGVADVHDLHVWSVTGEDVLVTCHIVTGVAAEEQCSLLDAATETLGKFGVGHSTIQLESEAHQGHEVIHH